MSQTYYVNPAAVPVQAAPNVSSLSVTIFDGIQTPATYLLSSFGKAQITFGRAPGNDLMLYSPIVSSLHGRFIFQNGRWYIEDRAVFGGTPSKNGLIYNILIRESSARATSSESMMVSRPSQMAYSSCSLPMSRKKDGT